MNHTARTHAPAFPAAPRIAALSALAAGLLLLLPGTARAQEAEEPIETDRPDITETSNVVGMGRFQIETSLLWERSDGGGGDERSFFTPTLLRYGFHPRWELRLETDGYSRTREFDPAGGVQRSRGYSPLAPGLKWHLQDPREGSARPSLGAIFHLNVPSGSAAFRTDRITGDAKLAADWDLAPGLSFGSNLGLLIDEDDAGEVFTSVLLTGALARDLSERSRVFGELVFQGPESDSGGHALLLDGGFVYLLNPDTQVDVAVGTSLAGGGPDLFWTVGFSRRF